jgi:hypothetical protein
MKVQSLQWQQAGFGLVIALRPHTPKHIRGGWSHYTDTSEPVDGNVAQNMVTVQSGFEPATFSITGPRAFNQLLSTGPNKQGLENVWNC